MERLTHKQIIFCEEYIKDFNASAAYRRSGYILNKSQTSPEKLLKKQKIISRIESLCNKNNIDKNYEIFTERLKKRLKKKKIKEKRDERAI